MKNRWLMDTRRPAEMVIAHLKTGSALRVENAPFGLTDEGLIDLKGLNLSGMNIRGWRINGADLSYSTFANSRIESSHFQNIKLLKVDFRKLTDIGNSFDQIFFSDCKFNEAGIGYGGSCYNDCVFDHTTFTKAVFIRSGFLRTKFVNCRLNGIDFNASAFSSCSFVGELKDVWFRGGYAFPDDHLNFGKADRNMMKNVSFEDAILNGVTYSNDCDLSTVKLPRTGDYLLVNNWLSRLKLLKSRSNELEETVMKEIQIFVNSHIEHAENQDWYIINNDEMRKDFGTEIASIIIQCLTN